jgi:hypothetical protein
MISRTEARPEPEWIRRMRADGYVVRRGTEEYYLPEEPEVRLKLPDEERRTLRTEIKAIAHKLWARLGNSARGARDAAVP